MRPLLEIDLSAIRHNYHLLCRRLQAPSGFPVIKDDGYGLGAEAVILALEGAGVEAFAVATLEEAQALVDYGVPPERVLVLYAPPHPGEIQDLLASGFQVAVGSVRMVEMLRHTESSRLRASLHLHVDIGMHRMGLLPEVARELVEAFPWRGLMLHFPLSPGEDPEAFAHLAQRAQRWMAWFREAHPSGKIHVANTSLSLAGLPWLEGSHPRPGLGLWGLSPSGREGEQGLRLAFRMKAPVVEIKEVPEGVGISYGWMFRTSRPSRIGVVAVGYADGLPRALSNRGWVLYRSRRYPIVGAVTMDLILVDFTGGPVPHVGEDVVLLGPPPAMTPHDWARAAGTIVYEVLTGLGKRASRRLFPAEVGSR